jgi:hypothetical protein
MRNYILIITMIVTGYSILSHTSVSADQASDRITRLADEIRQNSPSNLGLEQMPGQEDMEKDDILLKKNVEFLMLQEKHRIYLLLAIVISTVILMAMVLFCLKNTSQCSEESIVNAIGLVLVIEGTMFIAVSALTTEQLTAPIGILGAIAGYLFGSAKRRVAEKT